MREDVLDLVEDMTAEKMFLDQPLDQKLLWLFRELRKVNGRARDAAAVAEMLTGIVMPMKTEEEHDKLVDAALKKQGEEFSRTIATWGRRVFVGAVAAPGFFLGLLEVIQRLK